MNEKPLYMPATDDKVAAGHAISVLPADLIAAGFSEVTYEGQDGVFLVRRTRASDMPYLSEQVDNEFIYENSIVITEVIPDGRVQISISDTGYSEDPVDTASEEGNALLRDCLAAKACSA